jgi:transcriptional regulator of heat shock response
MDARQSKLLAAIIDEFIKTAMPVGSKQIIESGYFLVSGATVRNEMRQLAEEGLIDQPHTSAGRVPTAKGYRTYVKQFMQPSIYEKRVRQKFDSLKDLYLKRKDQERVYDSVALLSHMIPNVAFATVPHKERIYYLGLSNILREPEFVSDPRLATGVVEVLENRLTDLLEKVDVDGQVRYYIGGEHLLPQIQSCSMVVTEYRVRDQRGVIGILGPMRMDYGYNTVALDLVSDLLRS